MSDWVGVISGKSMVRRSGVRARERQKQTTVIVSDGRGVRTRTSGGRKPTYIHMLLLNLSLSRLDEAEYLARPSEGGAVAD